MPSFFKKIPQPAGNPPVQQNYIPPTTAQRGTRGSVQRMSEDDMVPDHRKHAPTKKKDGKPGLTSDRVLARPPGKVAIVIQGKTGFKMGFFDMQGYWVTRNKNGTLEVRRGATRAIHRLMTKGQRWELDRLRLQARREGVR